MSKESILQFLSRFGSPLFTGAIVGVVFRIFKLPIPAPNVIEGILGILGIFLGYKILDVFMK